MERVMVSLGDRSYSILIGSGLIQRLGSILNGLKIGRDALIVTNKTLFELYFAKIKKSIIRSGMSAKLELVPDSEKAKSYKILINLLDRIGSYDKSRKLFIIALGGGVIGDLAGFAASIYKRGIPYVQVPTTLLAQVDSAIGGKAAIDLPVAKNLVGSFYQPKAVISDISLLNSLSQRHIRSGLAECIKYGVIKDKLLFEYIEDNIAEIAALKEGALLYIISASSRIKAKIVQADEFDKKGNRAILNYGHTIGHAIEAASGYSKKYSHGEAVAIGMTVAARIASELKLLKTSDGDRIESLIEKCGLPTRAKGLEFRNIYNAHLHDKKFIHGKNRFVLPTGIGSVRVVEDVPDRIVIKSIKEHL